MLSNKILGQVNSETRILATNYEIMQILSVRSDVLLKASYVVERRCMID